MYASELNNKTLFEFTSRYKLKKLLAILATLVPYTPNITDLSNVIEQ
jgi:hypothetical protein